MLWSCSQAAQWLCLSLKQTESSLPHHLWCFHSAFPPRSLPLFPSLQTAAVVPASSPFGSLCLEINHIHTTPELLTGAGWDQGPRWTISNSIQFLQWTRTHTDTHTNHKGYGQSNLPYSWVTHTNYKPLHTPTYSLFLCVVSSLIVSYWHTHTCTSTYTCTNTHT